MGRASSLRTRSRIWARRTWFAPPQGSAQVFCTDDDGCLLFDVFPGHRFVLQQVEWRGTGWKPCGPAIEIEPAVSTTVVVPDAALAPRR